MIQTYTMVGSWFQKYDRRGKRTHLRYCWINPYVISPVITNLILRYMRMLNWSEKPPGAGSSGGNSKIKNIVIESVSWNQGAAPGSSLARLPPGPSHVIRLETPGKRVVRILATNWHDYDHWVRGLALMMKKSPPSPVKGGQRLHAGSRLGIGLDFLDEIKNRKRDEAFVLEGRRLSFSDEIKDPVLDISMLE